MTQALIKRRWLKWVIALLILILLLISILPYGIRYGIENWYQKQGVEFVSLEDVNLNLFTGKLQLSNLKAQSNKENLLQFESIIVEFDWMPLFQRRIFLSSLQVNKLNIVVQQNADKTIDIAGIKIPASNQSTQTAETSEPWEFAVHGIAISQCTITATTQQQTTSFDIDHIKLDKLESWSQEHGQINFKGKVNTALLDFTGKLNPFAKQPMFEGDINIQNFDIAAVHPHIKDSLEDLKGQLSLKTKIKIQYKPDQKLGDQISLSAQSDIQLNNLLVSANNQNITQDKLFWQGDSTLALTPSKNIFDYHLNGQLSSENLDISSSKTYHYQHAGLNWNGIVDINDKSPLSVKGKLNGLNIQLEHLPSQQQMFTTNNLAVDAIDIQGTEKISTGKIVLKTLLTLAATPSGGKQIPALLQASSLELDNLNVQQLKQISIGNTQLNDALIHLHINKDGALHQLSLLNSTEQPTNDISSKKETTPNKTAMNFALSKFTVTGKSHIQVTDQSVSPMFKSKLLRTEAIIENIDSRQPDRASPFSFSSRLDEYSNITIKGKLQPFSSPLSLSLSGNIKNISLPIVSGYTAKTLGHDLESGQLNADITVDIKKGEIDALAKLLISNLNVKPSDPKKASELTAQISMPLDSALSLLRDKKNDIKLEIPVSGNINKPDFDIGGIINKAIGTALKKTTMTYLTLALQPYGALIALANMADAASNAVTLNPVYFSAASTVLTQDANAYATKIAGLMKERPQLRIKLCGKAVDSDRQKIIADKTLAWRNKIDADKKLNKKQKAEAIQPTFTASDEELIALANLRANGFKLMLVKQHSIDPSRLFLCQPAIDKEKLAKPRLDITI